MAKKTRKKAAVVKKKKWVSILSPDNRELGECHIEEPGKIMGRRVKANLMNLMNDPRKRIYNVTFTVTEFDGIKAKTRITGYSTQPTSIKMMIRKGHDRVDSRYKLTTSTKEQIIIKPIMITLNNVSNSVKTALRKSCKAKLTDVISKTNPDALFGMIINHRLQKDLKRALAKVYPLKTVEIKIVELVQNKKQDSVKIVKNVKEEKTAEPVEKKEVKPEVKKEAIPEVKSETETKVIKEE